MDELLNNSFKIPFDIKHIRLDIGLSHCAPNSAVWLSRNPNTFVIGIEANKYAVEHIKTYGIRSDLEGTAFETIPSNYMLLNIALDNVTKKTKKPFYHMSHDVGVSSLLKPTERLDDSIKELSDVDVYPLSDILDKIDWDRFEYIDMIKIDTQGKDLDIIKSAGKHLDKVVYLNCEINTFGCYEDSPNPEEYDLYLFSKGFEKVSDNSLQGEIVVDRTYINKKFIHLKNEINNFVL
jgi:hypothetical protein